MESKQYPRVGKDMLMLQQMGDRAHELLAEFNNLSPSERAYAASLVIEFATLVGDFKRLMEMR